MVLSLKSEASESLRSKLGLPSPVKKEEHDKVVKGAHLVSEDHPHRISKDYPYLHPRVQLQDWLNKTGGGIAVYKCLTNMDEVDHLRARYDYECILDDGTKSKAFGKSLKGAARNAAIMMLRKLGQPCVPEIKF